VAGETGKREFSLRDYLGVIERRRWLLIGVFAVFVVVALLVSFRTKPSYEATTELSYAPQAPVSSITQGGSNYVSPTSVQQTLQTAAAVLVTPEMAQRVADALGLTDPKQLDAKISGGQMANTSLLTITAQCPNAQKAAVVANAYGQAWVAWSRQLDLDKVDEAVRLVKLQLVSYKTAQQKKDPAYFDLKANLTQLITFRAAVSKGEYAVASAATVPKGPYTPKHLRDGLLGVVLGVVVGLASVFLAEQLDVRVHSNEEVADALDLPVLGRLPQVPKELGRDGSLVVLHDPDSPGAEAFRVLRGNLDFVGVDGEVRSILITSCTQGEGKTSTACNLAVALAMAGKRVVVVDADMRRPRVHGYFGLPNRTGLSTVVAGKARLGEALQVVVLPDQGTASGGGEAQISADAEAQSKRIYVITSGPIPPNPGEIVTSKHLEAVLAELVKGSDMVLVDAPPFMVVGDAAPLAARTDGIMLVFKMGQVTKGMLKEARDFLAPLPSRKLGIVLANVPVESGRYKYYRQQADEKTAPPVEAV
jgi:non-specific protein-tyrosine kinase